MRQFVRGVALTALVTIVLGMSVWAFAETLCELIFLPT